MERVDLAWRSGTVRLRRWRNGWTQSPFVTYVCVGRLADGRWYAQRYGRGATRRDLREGACVYEAGDRGRWYAEQTARRWRRTTGGDWIEEE